MAVLGAGGAAAGVAYGLASAGARVLICNRSEARARSLCERIGAATGAKLETADATTLVREPVDAVVNCTPVGMRGGVDPSGVPIPLDVLDGLAKAAVVMDTVYAPERTPLIRAAEVRGLRAVTGVSMFVRQAEMQFVQWTGRAAPAGMFGRLARGEADS